MSEGRWYRVVQHGELGWRIGRRPESTVFVSDCTPPGRAINADMNRRYALAQLDPDSGDVAFGHDD